MSQQTIFYTQTLVGQAKITAIPCRLFVYKLASLTLNFGH